MEKIMLKAWIYCVGGGGLEIISYCKAASGDFYNIDV